VVSDIKNRFRCDLQLSDWRKLAGLPAEYTAEDLQDLFYPDWEESEKDSRREGFLTAFDDDQYSAFHDYLNGSSQYQFVNIEALLKITEKDGKCLSTVLTHIVHWVNLKPAKPAKNDNNKPLLREDLVPSLQKRYPTEADKQSIIVQREILDFVQSHINEFCAFKVKHFLTELPDKHDTSYVMRFQDTIWQELLCLVLELVGPGLQHPLMTRFNKHPPAAAKSKKKSSLDVDQQVQGIITRIFTSTANPALRTEGAADNLRGRLKRQFAQWVVEVCDFGLADPGEDWKPSEVAMVKADRAQCEALLRRDDSSPPPDPEEQATPGAVEDSGEEAEVAQTRRPRNATKTKTKQAVPASPASVLPTGADDDLGEDEDEEVTQTRKHKHATKTKTKQAAPASPASVPHLSTDINDMTDDMLRKRRTAHRQHARPERPREDAAAPTFADRNVDSNKSESDRGERLQEPKSAKAIPHYKRGARAVAEGRK
jgi:hypothetical protein